MNELKFNYKIAASVARFKKKDGTDSTFLNTYTIKIYDNNTVHIVDDACYNGEEGRYAQEYTEIFDLSKDTDHSFIDMFRGEKRSLE